MKNKFNNSKFRDELVPRKIIVSNYSQHLLLHWSNQYMQCHY